MGSHENLSKVVTVCWTYKRRRALTSRCSFSHCGIYQPEVETHNNENLVQQQQNEKCNLNAFLHSNWTGHTETEEDEVQSLLKHESFCLFCFIFKIAIFGAGN